ncbi:MAG: thioredoxin-disulfide reductase [Candidatus Omnitrophica bacterium]|nr:thioredoxin-disulfide reductase [Candidatus Omnitrophota bacterium]
MEQPNISDDVNDIVIIGGGPAGLTAGIYCSRSRMKTALIESMSVMGQITMTEEIENYPGIKTSGGFDLVMKMKEQAMGFGLTCETGTVLGVKRTAKGGLKCWEITHETASVKALACIIATGARPKGLGVKGEEEFRGKGVSYCATCDAAFFRDKDIVVVGGGDTAVEEAIYLTKFGKKVTIIHRRDRLRAAKIIQERAFNNNKIEFAWNSVIEEISGKIKVEKVHVKDVITGKRTDIKCEGVFVFAGWAPNTAFLGNLLEADKGGNIKVTADMKTSEPGIFACGDCCDRPFKQVVTACGDGAVAAHSAQLYVEELKGEAYK